MRLYEVMVIFHSGQEAEAIQAAVRRFGSVVSEREGSVSRVDEWGRRRFAYEMEHHKDGIYVVMELTATAEAVQELDRVLSISDEVVRHKIVRLPDAGIPAVVAASFDDPVPERPESLRGGGRDER
jgi:small subunit ribosomal protein S6